MEFGIGKHGQQTVPFIVTTTQKPVRKNWKATRSDKKLKNELKSNEHD